MTYSYRMLTGSLWDGTILKIYKVNVQELEFVLTDINEDMIVRLRKT